MERYSDLNEQDQRRQRIIDEASKGIPPKHQGKITSPEVASIAGKYVELTEAEIVALMMNGHAGDVARDLKAIAGSALVQA